jgi:hypothetical protein
MPDAHHGNPGVRWTDVDPGHRTTELTNVYIYVGDAVRWDFLPGEIAERGVVLRTVAASTWSAPSFASILTGLSPAAHGVHSFEDRIPESATTMHDLPGTDVRFVNTIQGDPTAPDPIYSIQGRDPPTREFAVGDLRDPFVVVERGPGGHAPYDGFGGADTEYFSKLNGASTAELHDRYREMVARDRRQFLDRLRALEGAGLADDTLVVYSSDHGELLGEHGLIGHNAPMFPELVYVPTVFVHPSLPAVAVEDTVFRHIDLLPTVQEALGVQSADGRQDGVALSTLATGQRGLAITRKTFAAGTPLEAELFYEGVWTHDGGQVFPRSGPLARTKILAGKLLASPKRPHLRRNALTAARTYLAPSESFGDPPDREAAASRRPDEYDAAAPGRLAPAERRTLEDLGYLD